jgi:hypothetical protein
MYSTLTVDNGNQPGYSGTISVEGANPFPSGVTYLTPASTSITFTQIFILGNAILIMGIFAAPTTSISLTTNNITGTGNGTLYIFQYQALINLPHVIGIDSVNIILGNGKIQFFF